MSKTQENNNTKLKLHVLHLGLQKMHEYTVTLTSMWKSPSSKEISNQQVLRPNVSYKTIPISRSKCSVHHAF